jgi:hypothetical protein
LPWDNREVWGVQKVIYGNWKEYKKEDYFSKQVRKGYNTDLVLKEKNGLTSAPM